MPDLESTLKEAFYLLDSSEKFTRANELADLGIGLIRLAAERHRTRGEAVAIATIGTRIWACSNSIDSELVDLVVQELAAALRRIRNRGSLE